MLSLFIITLILTLGGDFLTPNNALFAKEKSMQVTEGCNPLLVDNDPQKLVCVCDKNSCGQISFDWPQSPGQISIVRSSLAGDRWKVEPYDGKNTSSSSEFLLLRKSVGINVELEDAKQAILGWGGAFTDATGENLFALSEERSNQLMGSYFGDKGLEYNFGRVPIGGSDFSSRKYSYDDTPKSDLKLEHWSLADEDIKLKIPMINMAKKLMENTSERKKEELKLISAPWSPPKWMKTNNDYVRGYLIDDDQVYKSYAEYLMKFFDAYEERGISFFGTTVQNEPGSAYLPFYFFNSLQLGPEQAIKFVSKFLGPALKERGRTPENGFHLIAGDENLGFINRQVGKIFKSPEAKKYFSGLAFHWYTSGIVPYDRLTDLYNSVKNDISFMIMSEACTGSNPTDTKVELGSWNRGKAYATDIIKDLHRMTNGWVDWNLALNLQGGPNWSGNFVDSPIIVDSTKDTFYKQPMYYALAHFSRLFRPGSIVVGSSVWGGKNSLRRNLLVAAVHKRETNHVVVNLLNRSSHKGSIELTLSGLKKADAELTPIKVKVDGDSLLSVVIKL